MSIAYIFAKDGGGYMTEQLEFELVLYVSDLAWGKHFLLLNLESFSKYTYLPDRATKTKLLRANIKL